MMSPSSASFDTVEIRTPVTSYPGAPSLPSFGPDDAADYNPQFTIDSDTATDGVERLEEDDKLDQLEVDKENELALPNMDNIGERGHVSLTKLADQFEGSRNPKTSQEPGSSSFRISSSIVQDARDKIRQAECSSIPRPLIPLLELFLPANTTLKDAEQSFSQFFSQCTMGPSDSMRLNDKRTTSERTTIAPIRGTGASPPRSIAKDLMDNSDLTFADAESDIPYWDALPKSSPENWAPQSLRAKVANMHTSKPRLMVPPPAFRVSSKNGEYDRQTLGVPFH